MRNVTEEEYNKHIENEEKARNEKTKDKEDYDSDAEAIVLTIDAKAVLLFCDLLFLA